MQKRVSRYPDFIISFIISPWAIVAQVARLKTNQPTNQTKNLKH